MFQAVEDSLQDFKLIKMVWKTQCFCILSIFDFSWYVSSIWLTASEARRRAEVLSGGNKRKLSAALALAWVTQECGACPVSHDVPCPFICLNFKRLKSIVPYAPDIVYLVHAQTYPCNSLASFCL